MKVKKRFPVIYQGEIHMVNAFSEKQAYLFYGKFTLNLPKKALDNFVSNTGVCSDDGGVPADLVNGAKKEIKKTVMMLEAEKGRQLDLGIF